MVVCSIDYIGVATRGGKGGLCPLCDFRSNDRDTLIGQSVNYSNKVVIIFLRETA